VYSPGIARRVIVNGTFDILHRGHIEMLNYAKSQGTYLLVAIDSDKLVKELKGDREKLARFAMGVTSILEDVTEILGCQDNGDLAEVYMDFHCSIPDNEDEDEE
jgi:cytidyltransferase-like protein